MKKLIVLTSILINSFFINAQDFNYGIILGSFYHDFENKGPIDPGVNYSIIDFGVFGEHQLNSKSGILAKLNYSAKVVDDGYSTSSQFIYTYSGEINFSAVNFSTHYKFDTNNAYGKGFYLLMGPRISFISNPHYKGGPKLKDFYEPIRIAGQLGFGLNILEHYATELLFDYGLTNPLDSENNKTQTAGVNFNFIIDIESLIKK